MFLVLKKATSNLRNNHGVPGSEIGRKPTNYYLICISRKVLGEVNTSGTQTIKSENNIPSIINDLALSKFTDSKPLKWREGRIFPREDLVHWKFILCIFLPAWPKRSVAFYQGCCATLGQRKEIFWGLSLGSEMLLIPGDQNVTGLSSKSRGTMEVMWSRFVSSGLSHMGSIVSPKHPVVIPSSKTGVFSSGQNPTLVLWFVQWGLLW